LIEVTIPLRSHDEAILVLGPYDRFAKLLRQDLEIELFTRRGNLRLKGGDEDVQEAKRRIEHLLGKARKGRELQVSDIEAILLGGDAAVSEPVARSAQAGARVAGGRPASPYRVVRPGLSGSERSGGIEEGGGSAMRPRLLNSAAAGARGMRVSPVEPRTENQRRYLDLIEKSPLVFGIGTAGTGKTYLAVAAAVRALRAGTCRRLVITRPVVEAGERLGFLPGDVQAKLNPYLRPIYDSLYDLVDFEDVSRLEETGVIEVAPLAFMRGRTLSHAFAILDEAQNTTVAQMKMFLTRMGEGSRMVVTGDPTQSDLDEAKKNGLLDATARLRGYKDIGFVEFGVRDIVRHPLVEQIVKAYDAPLPRSREGQREGAREAPREGERP
jgi:phosphate starvation-inducible PhoH-like protein